jgi:hypothetical protein
LQRSRGSDALGHPLIEISKIGEEDPAGGVILANGAALKSLLVRSATASLANRRETSIVEVSIAVGSTEH